MAFCANCGAKSPANAKFCKACGKALGEETAETGDATTVDVGNNERVTQTEAAAIKRQLGWTRKGCFVLVIAVAVLGALIAIVAISSSKPDPADVAAARGCRAVDVLLGEAQTDKVTPASRQTAVDDAHELVTGTAEAKAAGKPAPKWNALGGDILLVVAAVDEKNPDKVPADAIASECGRIPADAKKAGGFVKSS